MKGLSILLVFAVLPCYMLAQQKTEYNRKGDDAMKRLDYSDARMWYGEGVDQCDSYSVKQLTSIWLSDERMRPSMRSLMSKCFNCVIGSANAEDTTAIKQVILYYKEGIGTAKSEELASQWQQKLDELRKPTEPLYIPAKKVEHSKPKVPMQFFVGYAFSLESPYGLTVGGVKSRLGWYARFRTNASFDGYTGECRGDKEFIGAVPGDQAFKFTNEKKINSYAGTAGLVVRCTSWLYTSVGVGYGNRELLCEYKTLSDVNSSITGTYWAKNASYSYKGLAADLDVMLKFGPVFVSAGCNTINFKYIDLNAGLGVFF